MEKRLKKLFDFHRFMKNEKLEKMIRETESRYADELSDDDLSRVNAAGEIPETFDGDTAKPKGEVNSSKKDQE